MLKLVLNYTQKDGTKIKNQLYTPDGIISKLRNLEEEKATDIYIYSVSSWDDIKSTN